MIRKMPFVTFIKRAIKFSVATAFVAGICSPLSGSHLPTELENVYADGFLNVISRNGPTTYFEGPQGLTGLEYDLAKGFADFLGVELVIQEQENLNRIIAKVAHKEAHFAAAGLTASSERAEFVRFTQAYTDVSELLIYNRSNPKPESYEDLVGKKILVMAGSAHAQRLRDIQKSHPKIQWAEHSEAEMVDLIEMVHNGDIDYTMVDSNVFSLTEKIYPRAGVAIELEGNQGLAWAFPNQVDSSLYLKAQEYFDSIKESGQLASWMSTYQNEIDLDQSGALTIAKKIETRLPSWEEHLRDAGAEFNLEWQLLAAISYQESHWNPKARSRTGVRGFMMLTQATAAEMGVTNRVDPVQSINGGAKYFKSIFERIPERIQGEDRTLMALAAYNVGMGHLEDARILTERAGGNPDRWQEVKQYLPLLSKRKYYRTVKHGYARGWEPVQYVENIRRYYAIITWHDTFTNNRALAAESTELHSDVRPVTFQNESEDLEDFNYPLL